MNAKVLVIGAVSCMIASASAQTVYKVPADSKENTIVLTVANESKTVAAQNVSVRLGGEHRGLTLSPGATTIKQIAPAGTSDVIFKFSVSRDVLLNRRDTLNFEIGDLAGDRWTKSIVVEFTGPQEYHLYQNYPNPFNPTTTIRYDIPRQSHVVLKLYTILGQEVATLVDAEKQPGRYTAVLDATRLASGIYFYRVQAGSFVESRKLVVLR